MTLFPVLREIIGSLQYDLAMEVHKMSSLDNSIQVFFETRSWITVHLVLWDFFVFFKLIVSETDWLLWMSLDKVGKEMNEVRDFISKVKSYMKTWKLMCVPWKETLTFDWHRTENIENLSQNSFLPMDRFQCKLNFQPHSVYCECDGINL